MKDRTRMEQLFVALEKARCVEKELDLRNLDEDDRRTEKIAVRFGNEMVPAPRRRHSRANLAEC